MVIFDKLHVLKKFNSQEYKLKLCTNIPSWIIYIRFLCNNLEQRKGEQQLNLHYICSFRQNQNREVEEDKEVLEFMGPKILGEIDQSEKHHKHKGKGNGE